MSPSRKATGYLQSLQKALDSESYHEVPELSRKVRKHDHNRTCYARSAEVQASLLQKLKSAQDSIDNANFNGPDTRFRWLTIDAQQLSAEKKLLAEAYAAHTSASDDDKIYYDIANVFYGIVIRQLDAALDLSPQLALHHTHPFFIISTTLLGVLDELLLRSQDAVSHYVAVTQQRSHVSPASARWLDLALYRLAILRPTASTSEDFLKHNAENNKQSSIRKLHVLSTRPDMVAYSKELLRQTAFPAADSINVRLLNHTTNVMEPWIAGQEDILVAEQHLEMLYQVGAKTFHSPRVLRYMVHVLSALERFDEAFLALKAYLQIAIHTQMTQPGSDVDSLEDIVQTIHYVVTTVIKRSDCAQQRFHTKNIETQLAKIVADFRLEKTTLQGIVRTIQGHLQLLEYRHTHEKSSLEQGIALLLGTSAAPTSAAIGETLAIAYCQLGNLPAAIGSIRDSLSSDNARISALLVFANLLYCEELFDRALAVLGRILELPRTTPGVTEHNMRCVFAKFMELKIIETAQGASQALERSSELLSMFGTYLGAVQPELHDKVVPAVTGYSQNSNIPMRPPTIRIESPAPTSSVSSLKPENHRTAPTNGALATHLHPDSNPRSASSPVRSSSLKLSHPQKHFPHHLNLRKSASVRSLRASQSQLDDSSRSSSPLNHPEPPVNSVLPDRPHHETVFESDTQPGASHILQKRQIDFLAEIWLYIAHLCLVSSAPAIDTEQAIEEARLLIGQAPSVLNMQLKLRLEIIRAQADASEDNWDLLEQGYDYSLNLDDDHEETILSFAEFLLIRTQTTKIKDSVTEAGRLARAYELLESLKEGPSAGNPKLWQLSGEIAASRGDLDRAEEDYWEAVAASDSAGVVDWYRLW